MFITEAEYIQAITRCDFLMAAEFPEFLARKYAAEQIILDADDLLALLVYALINQSASLVWEDIQLLYGLINDEEELFRDQLKYASTLLTNALIQTFIYFENNQLAFYQTDNSLSTAEILTWMQRQSPFWLAEKNNQELENKFYILERDKGQVLDRILDFKTKSTDYQRYEFKLRFYQARLVFEKSDDELASQRQLLLQAIMNHFKHTRLLSEPLLAIIRNIVGEIRQLMPRPWEVEILDYLVPRGYFYNLVDRSLQHFRFFSLEAVGSLVGVSVHHEGSSNQSSSNVP